MSLNNLTVKNINSFFPVLEKNRLYVNAVEKQTSVTVLTVIVDFVMDMVKPEALQAADRVWRHVGCTIRDNLT